MKHKARLYTNGTKQVQGIEYWNSYAPVVKCTTIRMMLILHKINGWDCRHLNYVLAFAQAPTDADVFLKMPIGCAGCIIKVENCPMCWVRKLQREVALSTTEAERISLSQSTRDLLPIKNIIEYLNKFIDLKNARINTHLTVFEDNSGVLHLATEPKYRPRTKHICVKRHHFKQCVKNKTIVIKAINGNDR